MNSHSLSIAPGSLTEPFPPLLPQARPWQKWISLGLSLALLAGLAWKLGDVGFANALRDLPGSLLFWIAFAGYYFALPASERSEEHTSELQSLMRTSYAVSCLKKKKQRNLTARTVRHIAPNS